MVSKTNRILNACVNGFYVDVLKYLEIFEWILASTSRENNISQLDQQQIWDISES